MLDGLLSLVLVLTASIDFELGELTITESVVRQHATDCFSDDSFGISSSQMLEAFFFEATREAGVTTIKLVGLF